MGKLYSLCISIQKLRQIKEKKSNVVSHIASPRWENFHKKRLAIVRFYDIQNLDSGVFIVKATKKVTQLGERVIKIELEKEVYSNENT